MPVDALPFLTPEFADASVGARVLHVVSPEGVEGLGAALGPEAAAWLAATGFKGDLGEVRFLPGADGSVAAAVAGFGTEKARRRQRFGLARAVAALPAGAWRLAGLEAAADRAEAALGALLAQYRFGRYRAGKDATGARLICRRSRPRTTGPPSS